MISNQKCEDCVFALKCVARNKMKPFTSEAKIDLGVDLDFTGCNNYMSTTDAEDENSDNF